MIMHFEKTLQVKEVLENRRKSPSYHYYLEGGFSGTNAEYLRLEKAMKESRDREEYQAIEKELLDLKFELRGNQAIPDGHSGKILTTVSEQKRIEEVVQSEYKTAVQDLYKLEVEIRKETEKYLSKVRALQIEAYQIDERFKDASNFTYDFSGFLRLNVQPLFVASFKDLNQTITQLGKVAK